MRKTPAELEAWVCDAQERTLELIADLSDDQLIGPPLICVNPLLWEIGHMAWFQEHWVLRDIGGRKPILENEDALYDSMKVHHNSRWEISLPKRQEAYSFMGKVDESLIERIHSPDFTEEEAYHVMYGVYHKDMHTEAFTYTRQTLGYSMPVGLLDYTKRNRDGFEIEAGPYPGDVQIPGGTFMLGAPKDEPFAFDNEKWAHPVKVMPFSIAKAAVTQDEFLEFVEDGGYDTPELWDVEGWLDMLESDQTRRRHPVHWRRAADGNWERRDFDKWVPLEPHRPVVHVNWYEAQAYCRWAGRRLPTEAEWELAASGEPEGSGFSARKRRYPWGDEPPTPERANLDWLEMGCADVGAFPKGDSAFGCRQMLGNVWEWTSSVFRPFPEFVVDPYKDYSEPWFHSRYVLRGGAWPTRSRLVRNLYRNYYTPERKDVWAGFRTCSL
jgi:iron(II)-dependent oxidoreductase